MGGGHGKHPLPCRVCWQQPEGEQRRLSVPVGGGSVSGVPGRRARHGRDPGSSCRSIHRIRLLGFHCLLCPPGSDPARWEGGAGNDASGTQVESEPRCLPACEDLPSGGRGAELTNGHVTLALQRVRRGCRRVAVGLWRREDPASTPRRRRGAPGCGVTASQRSGPRVGPEAGDGDDFSPALASLCLWPEGPEAWPGPSSGTESFWSAHLPRGRGGGDR